MMTMRLKPAISWRWILGFILLTLFLGTYSAQAAPLTYNSDFTVSLSSPAINFTIKSGSVADSVVVNSGNVVVTLSTSTGGTFTITSLSRDFSVATSSSGGTITQSCASGATLQLSQQTASSTYTITPAAAQCTLPTPVASSPNLSTFVGSGSVTLSAAGSTSIRYTVDNTTPTCSSGTVYSGAISFSASETIKAIACDGVGDVSLVASFTYQVISAGGSVSVGGGGGGGGGGYTPPVAAATTTPVTSAPVTATPSDVADQRAELARLTNLLSTLLFQLQARGISLPPGSEKFLTPAAAISSSSNLKLGSRGEAVKALQKFLIGQTKGPAAAALAKFGASGYFGQLTKAAVAEYQASAGINPANGNFGPKTRAYLKSIGY